MMKAHLRFFPLIMWMLAACAGPKEAVCAERPRLPAGKAAAAKPKVELDMSILKDLGKSGVTMAEVPGKESDKLGKLEIPFLGFVAVYSRTYILEAKELGFSDQRWTLHWTSEGHFLGADFKRPGFVPWKPAYEPTHRAYDEDSYRARSRRIVEISKAPVQVNFSTFIKEAADHAHPDAAFEQIQIRHILLKRDGEYGETTTSEYYTMRMNAKGIMQTSRGAIDQTGILFDKYGKALFMDNGL